MTWGWRRRSYARFLQVFTADVNMATAALETAAHEQPSFEGEFEVFSRCKALQQKRQSQNLGADKDMNLIAIVGACTVICQRAVVHQHSLPLAVDTCRV